MNEKAVQHSWVPNVLSDSGGKVCRNCGVVSECSEIACKRHPTFRGIPGFPADNEKAPIPEAGDRHVIEAAALADTSTDVCRIASILAERDKVIAALQAEVDALKRERDLLRMNHPFGPMYDALRKAQDENTALKDEVARLSAPVTDAARDMEKCSPRCVAYEAGDRFAVSHEDGCPNGGSKLAIKRGNFCTVPDCRFPDRHSTEVHRKHLATEQRLATPPQDVENGGKQ